MDWQAARILIVGKNYPALSKTYAEVTCTGGILEEDHRLVRLHPISSLMLEDEQRFKTFQWIRARIRKSPDDSRPETYRVDLPSIRVEKLIPASDMPARRQAIEACTARFASVEELQERQRQAGVSLGIVRPRRITGVRVRRRSEQEIADWVEKEAALRAQGVLFADVKPRRLDPPKAEFLVSWECDVPSCAGHEMALHQWGIHQLWRKLERDPRVEDKVEHAMRRHLDQSRHDVDLFLGNYSYRPQQFGLMQAVPLSKGSSHGPTLFD